MTGLAIILGLACVFLALLAVRLLIELAQVRDILEDCVISLEGVWSNHRFHEPLQGLIERAAERGRNLLGPDEDD